MLHISLFRSVAFLLQEQPLDDAEHGHLIRCNQCLRAMADAGLEELLRTDLFEKQAAIILDVIEVLEKAGRYSRIYSFANRTCISSPRPICST